MSERSFRVLVVEDDTDHVELMKRQLERIEGIEIAWCIDGYDALKRLLGTDPPDLLVLDMLLPGIGGREVIREMVYRRATIPTIAISGDPGQLSGLPEWVVVLPKILTAMEPIIPLALGKMRECSWATELMHEINSLSRACDTETNRRACASGA